MENKSSLSINIGSGFAGALTIAFIVLKLCHVIDWPWVWVLSPIWITAAIIALVLLIFGVFMMAQIANINRKNR